MSASGAISHRTLTEAILRFLVVPPCCGPLTNCSSLFPGVIHLLIGLLFVSFGGGLELEVLGAGGRVRAGGGGGGIVLVRDI